MNEQQLFRVTTKGCGTFHVVSASFDGAAMAVTDELNSQDYGFSDDRLITDVAFICRQQWMRNGRRALYGEDDRNHLVVDGSTSPEREMERLLEENAKLKAQTEEMEGAYKCYLSEIESSEKRNKELEAACANMQAERNKAIADRDAAELRSQELADQLGQLTSPVNSTTGAFLIVEERNRQIEQEGFDAEHDRHHDPVTLARAAAAYILYDLPDKQTVARKKYWPWDGKWWKPGDQQRNLVKAGALIAAAIDRLKTWNIPEEL